MSEVHTLIQYRTYTKMTFGYVKCVEYNKINTVYLLNKLKKKIKIVFVYYAIL